MYVCMYDYAYISIGTCERLSLQYYFPC